MSGQLEKGLVVVLAAVGVARPRLKQPPSFPAIRYQRILADRTIAVDGNAVGVTSVGMQIDCFSDSYGGSKDLADSVRGVLHGYIGQWGATTSPETHLIAHLVKLDTENDSSEQDGDKTIYWVSQRYTIWTNMD